MLRPATPLSILLFVSFVLLLISVISTPLVKGIPLARYEDVNFGVFGWCKDSGKCSGVKIGWNTDQALPAGSDASFNLPSGARNSLSSLLIVHPIAAFCNLIVLGLAIAAHFHSPSHSARYLLGLLILLLPTLLVTLLAFLVDILLFVPHLQWGGWIVLASTILITASGVVTCAMRRTLVSRKARKKRIAENAEMSGANFYARQAEESKMMPSASTESKMPIVNGAPGADGLPTFATYSSRRSAEHSMHQPSPIDPVSATSPVEGGRFYSGQRSRSNSRPRHDEFGAPLGASRSYEDRPPMPLASRGSFGPPRGRGGYPPRGRGSPFGPPRGAFAGRGRGGYPQGPNPSNLPPGVMIPAGMNRRPPPGYGPQSPQAYGPPQPVEPYVRNDEPVYEQRSPVSNHGPDLDRQYPVAYGARAQSPAQRRQSPYGRRSQSPMGAQPDFSAPPPMPMMPQHPQYAPQSNDRSAASMDSDILGMVEMQRAHPQVHQQSSPTEEYVPPRSGWTENQHTPHSPIQRKRVGSGGSDYLEDVEPKFAERPAMPRVGSDEQPMSQQVPGLLVPGRNLNDVSPVSSNVDFHLRREHSYEELHPGAPRSPVESETSNFTSVSQRPMNPNWQPGHGGDFNSFAPASDRRYQQRKQDMLFSNNPDFELPGTGPPRMRGGLRGRGFSGYGGSRQGPMRPPHPSALDGMDDEGRYPAAVPSHTGTGSMREI